MCTNMSVYIMYIFTIGHKNHKQAVDVCILYVARQIKYILNRHIFEIRRETPGQLDTRRIR